MKHSLIILISILLLSSPVIGTSHKGETLYMWGECCDWVWEGFGDKETHSVYKGDVRNGVPHGLGVLISTNGWKYFGSWKNGKQHGQGTFIGGDKWYHIGGKSVGEWKDGNFWNGTEYDKKGNITYKIVNGEWIEP